MFGWVCRTSALALAMLLASCISAATQDYTQREKLRAQSNEFRREVIRVTDGVYVAVGYSASNVILIQGDSGSIIVDTATDAVAARVVRTAFGDLLRVPVRAIIYTHSHPDHTGGARGRPRGAAICALEHTVRLSAAYTIAALPGSIANVTTAPGVGRSRAFRDHVRAKHARERGLASVHALAIELSSKFVSMTTELAHHAAR